MHENTQQLVEQDADSSAYLRRPRVMTQPYRVLLLLGAIGATKKAV